MAGFGRTLAAAAPTQLFALGQAGCALRGRERLVLIDPWLSTALEEAEGITRPVPPPLRPDEVEAADLVLITHEHADHLDPRTLAAIAEQVPGCAFAAPLPAVGLLVEAGVPRHRVTGLRADESAAPAGVAVTAFAAAHEPVAGAFGGYDFWRAESGEHRALGYVVELDGRRIAHTGDTIWWDGLERVLADLRPDVLIVPINGRDPLREAQGIWGNVDAEEAAGLAAAVGAPVVVPCHYDGVAGNLGDPPTFVRALELRAPHLVARVLAAGEALAL